MVIEPNVMLSGGPELTDDERICHVENTGEKLKLFKGHRYDHFEPTGQNVLHDGSPLAVFAWTGSTYVAE
jgi:hypothetical protein